jgi:hypothetical protein
MNCFIFDEVVEDAADLFFFFLQKSLLFLSSVDIHIIVGVIVKKKLGLSVEPA